MAESPVPPLSWLQSVRAHNGCEIKWSLQRFGEFVGWCHPVEGLSRSSVEGVCSLVEVRLGEGCHVGCRKDLMGAPRRESWSNQMRCTQDSRLVLRLVPSPGFRSEVT